MATMRYNYTTPAGMAAPATGGIIHPTAATTQMRINNVDLDAQNNSAVFAALTTADIVTLEGITLDGTSWSLTSVVPGASYLQLGVAPAGQQLVPGEYVLSLGGEPARQDCESCGYFYRDQYADAEFGKTETGMNYGGCHRYPPQVEITSGTTKTTQTKAKWPSVLPTDWCGEWDDTV